MKLIDSMQKNPSKTVSSSRILSFYLSPKIYYLLEVHASILKLENEEERN